MESAADELRDFVEYTDGDASGCLVCDLRNFLIANAVPGTLMSGGVRNSKTLYCWRALFNCRYSARDVPLVKRTVSFATNVGTVHFSLYTRNVRGACTPE